MAMPQEMTVTFIMPGTWVHTAPPARDTAWMPALTALAERGGSQFVVVGTGHLLGDDGLVQRLRAAGHRLARR
jgi:hypothetical protein